MKMRFELVLALLAAMAASGEVVYRNDFTTRTSVGSIPDAEWHELAYHTGTLYNNYKISGTVFYNEDTVFNQTEQDGWAKANIDNNYMKAGAPDFLVLPDGADNNPCAVFRSGAEQIGTAIHSLHNEFTNGILRIEADVRRPAVWGGSTSTYTCRVAPIYKKYLNPNWGVGINNNGTPIYPVMFGAVIDGNNTDAAAGVNRPILYYRNDQDARASMCPGASVVNYVCTENWYRWRVYLDLDSGLIHAFLWDAGAGVHPDAWNERADDTATRTVVSDIYHITEPMSRDTGGVAGICLNTYRTCSGTNETFAITNAPCFDNIRVAWKAPDGHDYKSGTYESCYENDFRTRRYRTLQPRGTNSCVYPSHVQVSTNSQFASYQVNRDRNTTTGTLYKLVRVQAGLSGVDNWRRLDGEATATVIDSQTQGEFNLRIHDTGKHIILGTRLYETVTSGKVRISADVRLPLKWHGTGNRRVCLALGNMAHWECTQGATGSDIGYGAIVGDNSLAIDEAHPAVLRPNGASLLSAMDTSVTCTAKNWFRMIVTADLDAKTYDYELWSLGDKAVKIDTASTETNPIYAVQGVGFRNNIKEISSFSLWNYGMGNDWDNFILWDSIRVWKNWNNDTGTGDLLYQNTFNARTHYFSREKTPIDGGVNRDDGVDGWTRRFYSNGLSWLAETNGNRFLRFKLQSGQTEWLQQDIGTCLTRGRARVTVDMRPPDAWVSRAADGAGPGRINFYVGGETFRQGNGSAEDIFYSHSVMTFGFSGNDAMLIGVHTNVTPRVLSGPGVSQIYASKAAEPSHWYRFEGTTLLGSGTSTVKIYDMGTTHPTIETPKPSEVFHTFDNLLYRGALDEGIASFAVTANNVCGATPWDEEDPGCFLLDNIVVESVPSGMMILVR